LLSKTTKATFRTSGSVSLRQCITMDNRWDLQVHSDRWTSTAINERAW